MGKGGEEGRREEMGGEGRRGEERRGASAPLERRLKRVKEDAAAVALLAPLAAARRARAAVRAGQVAPREAIAAAQARREQ